MKVIKPGLGPKKWCRELKCTGNGTGGGGCGETLLVEEEDLFRTSIFGYDSDPQYATFQCCECKEMTDFPDKLLFVHKLPTYEQWKAAKELTEIQDK